jgi:hypothetical protein
MAVTQTSVVASPQRLVFELAQDGAAGTTLTVAQAALVAAAASQMATSPIRRLIAAALASQAAARTFALQNSPSGSSRGGVARITPRGVAAAWAVDANVAANLLVYNVVAPAGADSALLEVQAPHSVGR